MSCSKLVVVLVIFFSVLAVYAVNITSASTKGYFHRQEMKKQDQLVFDRSIVDLDILHLEKKLLEDVQKSNGTWYGIQSRMEVVSAFEEDLVSIRQ